MSQLTPAQVKSVKSRGFLRNKDTNLFSARIITRNGVLNARQLALVAEAAEKFGDGKIAFTTRLTAELTGIPFEQIDAFCEFIAKENMTTGGTGSRVRPVVACKGTVCVHGLCDTQQMAEEIHSTFYEGWYDVKLPHKFKIAVGGCPNNCVKPDLNDFGIVGQEVPVFDAEMCNNCKKCPPQEHCPVHAFRKEDGEMILDEEMCNNCGKCIDTCNFDCVEKKESGYKIYIGGKWGKACRTGTRIPGVFTYEQVMSMIEKTLLLYREQGNTGERFGNMIDRLGEDYIIRNILSGDILTRKEDILKAELHLVGGATC